MSVCCSSDGNRLLKAEPRQRVFLKGTSSLNTSLSVVSIARSYEQTRSSFPPKVNHRVQIETAEWVKGLQNYEGVKSVSKCNVYRSRTSERLDASLTSASSVRIHGGSLKRSFALPSFFKKNVDCFNPSGICPNKFVKERKPTRSDHTDNQSDFQSVTPVSE